MLPFAFKCFFLHFVNQVRLPPSFDSWSNPLHMCPTIKPFKDLPPLLCPWRGKDYIRWCHFGCLWKMQNYCPKGANPHFSTAFSSIFSSTCQHCSIDGCTLVDVVIVNPTWIDLVSRTTFCCGVAAIVATQVSEGRPLSWLLPNGHVYSSCHRSFCVSSPTIQQFSSSMC